MRPVDQTAPEGPAMQARQLIVNADDYGYTPGVSAGIRRAHREGIVSSTSVMMTMPSAVAELARLRLDTPTLGVGIHLTVTEGCPFRLPRLLSPRRLAVELATVQATELAAEWRAQVDAFLATGLPLTHLDSHHHAAYRHATALDVLFDLSSEYGVPVRNPYPIGDAAADGLADRFSRSRVPRPAHFLDLFDDAPSAVALMRALESLPTGTTEIMTHPGLVDDELRVLCGSRADLRLAELEAVTHPDLRASLERLGIELVSFAGLASASS
jgi:predicted glycoside hydrolase/deacetylase ChbG (UPF0249 family)